MHLEGLARRFVPSFQSDGRDGADSGMGGGKADWDQRPASALFIKLIQFGAYLQDSNPLKGTPSPRHRAIEADPYGRLPLGPRELQRDSHGHPARRGRRRRLDPAQHQRRWRVWPAVARWPGAHGRLGRLSLCHPVTSACEPKVGKWIGIE